MEVARIGTRLRLHYCLTGVIADLAIPAPVAPQRRDDLWRQTCFEAFVRAGHDTAYHEFNFAPSSQWAAYRFDDYRSGMRTVEIVPPGIEREIVGNTLALTIDFVPGLSESAPWQVGLSAVIEEASGRKSYWALAHPPGAPDFHHRDCFTLQLPPAT